MKTVCATLTAVGLLAPAALAEPVHFEGFENPAFTPGGDNWNNNGGTIQRVTSGTNSVTSSTGTGHAVVNGNGPFTRFGGYSTSFGGGYTASLDVYLDPTWSVGTGFDYSVAASRQTGSHLRDFIFHVGVTDVGLLVNASNNTDGTVNPFKLKNENGGDNFTVTSAGWYTLEQDFYDNAGILAVDLTLYDDGGSELWSVTRSDPSDDIATTVGGNRYGWLVVNNVSNLAIDNTSLVPEPGSMALLGLGGVALLRRRRH